MIFENHFRKIVIQSLFTAALFISIFFLATACKKEDNSELIDMDDLYAWCIVPFDSVNRSPEERIKMLTNIGFKKYAYDWRKNHLENMAYELQLAKKSGVEIIAVWMWIDNNWDSIGKLNSSNEKVFKIIEESAYNGELWVSFNNNFFDNLSDSMSVSKGKKMISYLSDRAKSLGCKVALYNHGDWFGEPENQINIIKALPKKELGLVYNFHHAHNQIEKFPENVDQMLPYLWHVNLNGMIKEGPKILTIGEGNHEAEMIQVLKSKDYKGDYGILGHVENADVELILQANLKGVQEISD